MCMHTGIFVLTYRLGYGRDTNRAAGAAINTDGPLQPEKRSANSLVHTSEYHICSLTIFMAFVIIFEALPLPGLWAIVPDSSYRLRSLYTPTLVALCPSSDKQRAMPL